MQAALYQQAVEWLRGALAAADGMQRKGMILAFLMRLKQICNHPSQWLGDGQYAADASGKFLRLAEICDSIAARPEEGVGFSQFPRMTEAPASALQRTFGRPRP